MKQQFSREWTSDNNGSEPCETENSQGELCDCPSSLSWGTGKRKQEGIVGLLELGRQSWAAGETKAASVHKTEQQTGQSWKEISRHLWMSWKWGRELISCTCIRKLPQMKEKLSERKSENSTWVHRGLRRVPDPTSQIRKPNNSWGPG